jgi:glycosyltransferase involved in cell wall biosynthesis
LRSAGRIALTVVRGSARHARVEERYRLLKALRRVALITPYLPAPAHNGGRIRMYRLARGLAGRFEVHLFSAADPHDVRVPRSAAELSLYAGVHIEPRFLALVGRGGRPARVRSVTSAALLRAFTDAHDRTPFAAAVVEHSYSALPVHHVRAVPWVLDEHNVESEYARARSRARHFRAPIVSRVVDAWDARRADALSRWEEAQWRTASDVVCVSPQDAERVEAVRRQPVTVIPNGVATEEVPFALPSQRTGHDVLFVGTFEHPPNIAAARWLAREILPKVWQTEPRARLILCGSRPVCAVRQLASERVVVTGSVPSVARYLAGARVYANAVQHGGGTSLKVLEALASGVPLVSTAVGARGFELRSPEHYLQAEDTDSFVRQLVACLRDAAPRDTAAARGREIAERCSWTRLAARFADVVERAVGLPTAQAARSSDTTGGSARGGT